MQNNQNVVWSLKEKEKPKKCTYKTAWQTACETIFTHDNWEEIFCVLEYMSPVLLIKIGTYTHCWIECNKIQF